MGMPGGDMGMGMDMGDMPDEDADLGMEMEMEMEGLDPDDPESLYGESYPGGEGFPGAEGGPKKPPRPEKVAEWTTEQIADAISESDEKAIAAIDHYAKSVKGASEEVPQWSTWIAALSKSGGSGSYDLSGGDPAEFGEMEMEYGDGSGMSGGGSSVKGQIAQVLIKYLMANGTDAALAEVQKILSGETKVGVSQQMAISWVVVELMKAASKGNGVAESLLLTALERDQTVADSAPTDGQPGQSAVTFEDQAKDLHIGFLIAAMNNVIGIQKKTQQRSNGGYDEFGDMADYPDGGDFGFTGEGIPGGNDNEPPADPVQIPEVELTQADTAIVLGYLWNPKIVNFAASQLAQNPDSTEALIMAAALPMEPARAEVRKVIEAQKKTSPKKWLQQKVFEDQLGDPSIHLLIKSFDREQRPAGSGGDIGEGYAGPESAPQPRNRSRSRTGKEPDPAKIAAQEARYGWMDAAEMSLESLLERMYQGSLSADATPVDEDDLPFNLHKGAEITTSLKFALPQTDKTPQLASPRRLLSTMFGLNPARCPSGRSNTIGERFSKRRWSKP